MSDFHETVVRDPVMKAHFADFKWDKATMGKLEKPLMAYVYYRKDDTIFRKATPINLPAGDVYITDGTRRVRAHCCNNYTEEPPPAGAAELPAAVPPPSGEETVSYDWVKTAFFNDIPSHYGEWYGDLPPVPRYGYKRIITADKREPDQDPRGGGITLVPNPGTDEDPSSRNVTPVPEPDTDDDTGGGDIPPIIDPGTDDDTGDEDVTPIPEPDIILLVGIGLVVTFVISFLGNDHMPVLNKIRRRKRINQNNY